VRRAVAVVLGTALAAAILLVNAIVFNARDDSPVNVVTGPGEAFRDQCAAHTRGQSETYDSTPPTSGPHLPKAPAREQIASPDELLQALELGDVVILYPSRTPPLALRKLQDDLAGPFDLAVAAVGQSVILSRDPTVDQITALAWRHRLRVASAGDARLREFADFWLGRGYAEAHGENCPPAG
jgi:Protein of unknown function (DUF3105)